MISHHEFSDVSGVATVIGPVQMPDGSTVSIESAIKPDPSNDGARLVNYRVVIRRDGEPTTLSTWRGLQDAIDSMDALIDRSVSAENGEDDV